ncbi:MAG: hypothetical protein E7487_01080 [Ruminococcaceae bacterium]|nr:hypothetical protein [Oscillospiraceae bacterium]
MENIINLGKKREMFWDNYLVDDSLTTAQNRMQKPVCMGTVFWLDNKLEDNAVSYPCIMKDDKGYRMYYIAWHRQQSSFKDDEISTTVSRVCVLESQDGLKWTRPNVGLYEFEGNTNNNIVIPEQDFRDNAFVFYDTNPNCPPEEKYKCFVDGIPAKNEEERRRPGAMKRGLWYYYSADGYKFHCYGLVSVCGNFDTLNTARWDGERYVAYIRNYHGFPMDHASGAITVNGIEDVNAHSIPGADKNLGIRDIRVMYSDDFRNWTRPERIHFNDEHDIPMYTNNVIVYDRAPHILIGMPVRYCERTSWTPNFDQMPRVEFRKECIAAGLPREGLAITDCIFMWSRDGMNWDRSMESFMTPRYETAYNWVYGDCYPSYGYVDEGDENINFFTIEYSCVKKTGKPLVRHRIRKDGFGFYWSGGKEETLVTKPIIFEGSKLHLNFEGSAFGHLYVEVLTEDGKNSLCKSFEIFGDNIDRLVALEDGTDFSRFAGQPIRLKFTMLDTKLYSLKFD